MAALHVAQLNFPPAPDGIGIEALLERWPSLADIAEVVAGAGIRVSVLQAASRAEHLRRNGIDYWSVDIGEAHSAGEKARRFTSLLAGMDVGLLHAHGLGFVEEATAIAARISPAAPIVFQDHADRPPRWWRRARHRRRFAMASGIAFTSLDQAQPFVAANLFAPSTRLFAIPESSSRFTVGDRDRARAESGLDGDPCVVWVGRLTRGKDPMTVLEGVALAAARLPNLQLWCAFGAVGAVPEEQPVIALGARDRAEADRDEAGLVAETHQRVGQRLDAAAAWRAVVVDAGNDDGFRPRCRGCRRVHGFATVTRACAAAPGTNARPG